MIRYTLTKASYLSGLNCEKALWLGEHAPQRGAPPSEANRHRMEMGTGVGLEARKRFPGGRLIRTPSTDPGRALDETRTALASSAPALFEAAFLFDGVFLRTDILRRAEPEGAWDLLEVKSSTRLKEEHLPDVAIQRHVAAGGGLKINGTYLMRVNPDCTYPDLSGLFAFEDLAESIEEPLGEAPAALERFAKILGQSQEPQAPIGPHCYQPFECPFRGYCWQDVPALSIFNIPRLSSRLKAELSSQGIFRLEDLPRDLDLSEEQRRFLDLALTGRTEIHWEEINRELAGLSFPLYFLDFETDGPAIPRYPGTRPYQQVPFQYSLHRLDADGCLSHFEYLHLEDSDPRPPLARFLLAALGPEGSVVAYYASFERSVLEGLAGFLPELAAPLQGAADRLWDLYLIFRNLYFDPAFGGSNSIKNVLPVVVPELSYKNLAIRDGAAAQAAWNRMIAASRAAEQKELVSALLEYCSLDSLAMVELYRALRRRAG